VRLVVVCTTLVAMTAATAVVTGRGGAEAAARADGSHRTAPTTRAFGKADLAPTADVSSNWSGYVVTGPETSYASATASWTQPKVSCKPSATGAASAFWVGLGGYSADSQALEQTGTEADCSQTGTPSYDAWYEIVPAPPVQLKLKVVSGDRITASVNVVANGTSVLFQVKNRTRHTAWTAIVPVTQPDLSSAEWIAEAPSECGQFSCRPVPLADFGSVSFSKIAALGNGFGGTMTNPAWTTTPVQLVPSAGRSYFAGRYRGVGGTISTAGATPTGPTAGGGGFGVSWQAIATGN
jgi:hypothetical protein